MMEGSGLMYAHKWTLAIEVETDQGVDGKHTTKLEVTGANSGDGGTRAVNECIAIDMATLCEMLLASGRLVCQSTMEESADAFSGG